MVRRLERATYVRTEKKPETSVEPKTLCYTWQIRLPVEIRFSTEELAEENVTANIKSEELYMIPP